MAAQIKQYATPIQQDATLAANVALPNAANTVNTAAIILSPYNTKPFPTNGKFTVNLSTTQSTGANSKNINVAIQHTGLNSDGTADNGNWTNIPELAVETIAGNSANFPAANYNFKLPDTCNSAIRATATGEANGGNASDGTMTIKLLF